MNVIGCPRWLQDNKEEEVKEQSKFHNLRTNNDGNDDDDNESCKEDDAYDNMMFLVHPCFVVCIPPLLVFAFFLKILEFHVIYWKKLVTVFLPPCRVGLYSFVLGFMNRELLGGYYSAEVSDGSYEGEGEDPEKVAMILNDLVQKRKWDAVVEYLHSCGPPPMIIRRNTVSDELVKRIMIVDGETGETVLHRVVKHAATLPTMDVIHTFMEYFPTAAITREKKYGHVPLFFACSIGVHVETVLALLSGSYGTDAVHMLDWNGRNALHIACLHCYLDAISLETIRELLLVDSSLVLMPDNFGKTPLQYFWESREEDLSITSSLIMFNPPFTYADLQMFDWGLAEAYCCAKLLIKEAVRVRVPGPTQQKWRLLHSILSLQNEFCPDEFLRVAIFMSYNEVSETDESGNFPLHLLASLPYGVDETLELLIRAYPKAIRTRNSDGLLPLEIALHASQFQWSECVEMMVNFYPSGLSCTNLISNDTLEGFMPFVSKGCSLSVIYRLLVDRPYIACKFLSCESSSAQL